MSPAHHSLLAALTLLPLLTSAQFNYDIGADAPNCAVSCLYNYISEGSTCLVSNDQSCICTAYNFLKPVAQCMYVNCTPEEAQSVWDSTKRDCIAYMKPLPEGAPEIWIGGLGDAEPSRTVDEPFPSSGAESSDTPRTSGTRGGSGSGGSGSGSNEKSGMSTAAIIGIVVGAVLVVAIVAFAAICITRSRNRKKIAAAAAAAAAASASRPSNNDGPPGGGRPNAPPAFATAGKPTYNPHQQPLMQHDHLAQQQQGYAGGGAYYHGDPEKNAAAFVGVAPVPTPQPQQQHQHAMYTPPQHNQAYQPHQHQQYQPHQRPNGAVEMGSGYHRPPSVPSTGGTVAPPPPPPPQMFPPRPQMEQIQPPQQQPQRNEGMHELPPAEDVVRAEMMGTVPEGPTAKKGTGMGLFGRKK